MWKITNLFILFISTIVLKEVVGTDQMDPLQENKNQPIFPFKWLRAQSKEKSTNGIYHPYDYHQKSNNNYVLPSFVFDGSILHQDAFEIRSKPNEDRPLTLYLIGNAQEYRKNPYLGQLMKTAPKQGKKEGVNLLIAEDEIGEVNLNTDKIIDGKMVYRFGKKFAVERGGEKNRLHRWISKRSTANDFMRKPPRAG